jgi:hypothetical protein
MKKITNEQFIEIVNVIGGVSLEDIGLKYAVTERFLTQAKTKNKLYAKKIREIDIETALKDPKNKRIVTGNNNEFVWDEAGMKARDERIAALNEEEIEIKPYIVPITDDIITVLGPFVIEMLEGITFKSEEIAMMKKELEEKAFGKPKYPQLGVVAEEVTVE